jgi:flagellin
MPLVVNTNLGSLSAQRSLATSGTELKTAMERLSSGKKINTAADDAAGFAIAERMTAQIRGLNMATKNANDGLAMLAVIENATNDVTDMLQRMRELAVQAANDTNGSTDRSFLQEEVNSLIAEVDRVATQTVYNNKVVLDGSLNGSIQVGTEAGQNVDFSIDSIKSVHLGHNVSNFVERGDVTVATKDTTGVGDEATYAGTVTVTTTSTTGIAEGDIVGFTSDNGGRSQMQVTAITTDTSGDNITSVTFGMSVEADADSFVTFMASGGKIEEKVTTFSAIQDIKLGTAAEASEALATITGAIEQVASDRASYGALQNRLEYTVSNLMNVAEFTTSARSRIEDADFAAESARLAKAQVLQQTGTAMLAQANQAPQLVLQLIR